MKDDVDYTEEFFIILQYEEADSWLVTSIDLIHFYSNIYYGYMIV